MNDIDVVWIHVTFVNDNLRMQKTAENASVSIAFSESKYEIFDEALK